LTALDRYFCRKEGFIMDTVLVADKLDDLVISEMHRCKYTALGDIECICRTTSESFPKTMRTFEIPGEFKLNALCSDVVYDLILRLWDEKKQIEFEVETKLRTIYLVCENYKYNSRLQAGSYVELHGNKIDVTGCALRLWIRK
jgi:hypothetical protein